MSCNCGNHQDVLEPLTNAAIILTKNDLYKIRTGRIIREHFHGSNLEYGKMTFFVSNEQNRVSRSSKMAKEALQTGDGLPIALTKQEIQSIQDGKIVQFVIEKKPPVTVSVMAAQTYHKMVTEQNKSAEAKLEGSDALYMEHVKDFLKHAPWEAVEKYDQERNS